MRELNNNIFNNNIAGDTSNILIPDNSAIKKGVVFKSNIDSNVLNGFYNILSKAIQYLQFTVGLYSKEADYNEGNIASLVIKDSENYSIWQFRRNSNNPQVLNNNPPITGASITAVNGIDIYEGGTLNTDWDKLTEDYDVEATPNTVMIRDEEGASNVNMPSNIKNTTVVNNEYLEKQLLKKQDKLTAGINVEITENNVINVKGDVATDANLVTQTNEALGENVQTALDILNKMYMINPYYVQYADLNGNFNSNEEPSVWFKKMYNVNTTWQIMFNTESVYFRTEGNLANVERSNGIQNDAGRNAGGSFYTATIKGIPSGVFFITNSDDLAFIANHNPYWQTGVINLDLSRAYATANEFRVKNRLIRIYKLLTINGKKVSDIIGAQK
ncbi:hypothetical protein [Brachyspira pilosicoli]|uniref:hypothetical protein n=1 Tax=Brachyspira pilosicoli TaxID=52584 RepID=UPI000CA73E00|nr:hypothetical protein [Brachyspira pilosicoli]PLV54708.1 hypothetical protein BPSP16_12610 [Brachyspira pilosicoli SP16]